MMTHRACCHAKLRPCSAAPVAAAAAPRRQLMRDQLWGNAFADVFPEPNDGRWHGWVGSWHLYDAGLNLEKEVTALRVVRKDSDTQVTGPVIITSEPAEGYRVRRSVDGLFARIPNTAEALEANVISKADHQLADGLWHPMHPRPDEAGELQVRLLAPFPGRQALAMFALPLQTHQDAAKKAPPFFTNLLLLSAPEGGRRTATMIYDGRTGHFKQLRFEREAAAAISDPLDAVCFADLPSPARPGPQLPEDRAAWLDASRWHGTARILHIGGTEGLWVEEGVPAKWTPPVVGPHRSIVRLPDGMYVVLPKAVPPALEVPQEGLEVEMGGFLSGSAFSRGILNYGSGDGRLTSVRFEDFEGPSN